MQSFERSEDRGIRVGRMSHDRLAPGTWLLNILGVSLRFVEDNRTRSAGSVHIRDSGCERYIIVFAIHLVLLLIGDPLSS